MKKQNRNVFAYVRQPNLSQNQDHSLGLKTNKQQTNQTMFNQIVGQMDQNLTKYLNKLVTKNQKQQEKKKSVQKSTNHQRTKSYADILVQTPSNSKNPTQKGHSHRGSHPSTQINNIFFSLNNSPTNQKKSAPIKNQMKTIEKKNSQTYSFLSTLDSYILDLSMNNSINAAASIRRIQCQDQLQTKCIQKTRENSVGNLKIIQKLQLSIKRQRQLIIANKVLVSENQKLKNKIKKNKNIVKTTMQDLYQYAQTLSTQLKQQKRQKRKLQEFISQLRSKFIMLRPQRKTSGARPRLEEYLFSQTTQQDDMQFHQQCPSQARSKSLKRRNVIPRSTAKQSRISGFNIQELSAMLASKNFQLQDEQQQSQNYQV